MVHETVKKCTKPKPTLIRNEQIRAMTESEVNSALVFKVNSWGSWGACNEKCAVGSRQRTRTVKISKRCQGKDCPNLKVRIIHFILDRTENTKIFVYF